MEDSTAENKENRKEKAIHYYQANKEKIQNRAHKNYRNLSEGEKIKKRNYANKNMSDTDRVRRKEYMKNYYYKRINLLSHLVNCIEELENACLSK